jgi:DNA-binding LytR/AlgR family response regulator
MGKIRKSLPVKLIIGFIFKEEQILKKTETLLKKYYGEIDFESQTLSFTHTDYYEKEFGRDLKRKFISFKKLIPPQNLPKIKITTNQIENKTSRGQSRRINIDPGYLDLSKLILASTKDYYHRIYLEKGIYAEITLFYRDKTFNPWEWTYPDYKTPEYIAIFNKIRENYAACMTTQPI